MTKYIKSPLNYHGGKYKLLPQIIPIIPNDIRIFVDMFCGGCNVGINIKANTIICNDNQKNLIDMYKTISSMTYEDILSNIQNNIINYNLHKLNQDGYLKIREYYNDNVNDNPILLLILSFYSFNNGIRFNNASKFNMPFGKREFNKSIDYNLKLFMENINKLQFINKDFKYLKIENLNCEDFIYADLPYLISSATYNTSWSEKDDYNLMELLDRANTLGIRFAMSNVLRHKGITNTKLLEWCSKYNIHHLNANYSNCNHQLKIRDIITDEVLITNY